MSALGHQSYLPQQEFSESLTCSHKHVRDAGKEPEAAGGTWVTVTDLQQHFVSAAGLGWCERQ